MAVHAHDLWSLVLDRQYVDPAELAEAIEDQVLRGDLDFRSRLLIRDAVEALRQYWGEERVAAWLRGCSVGERIETIAKEDLGRPGFPFLASQIMEPTKPETVREFLRELSLHVHRPLRLCVGGSVALIMPGHLVRRTQDLDVADEVPEGLRSQHELLQRLQQRYRLGLTHFQSHFLPSGWEGRTHFLDTFGRLTVYLVDAYDVFLSKLCSAREKDRDDLRAVAPHLDKDKLIRRLKDSAARLLAEADLRQQAAGNWYILYGESLPS